MSDELYPRDVFYISMGTGITSETLGHAVLEQFPIHINEVILPFIDTEERAQDAKKIIEQSFNENGIKPLVFYSIVSPEIRNIIEQSKGHLYDIFSTLVVPLEKDLQLDPHPTQQRFHSINRNIARYHDRISAIEYTLTHDNGMSLNNLEVADIILLGVSRCGKTPTCLYLALQYGIRAANYSFISDDMENMTLPEVLKSYRHKICGLTIAIDRLVIIRNELLANSIYASKEQCKNEIHNVENLFRQESIPFINTTYLSVEEISAQLLELSGIKRRRYSQK